jgi:hypothetical protein
MEKYGIFRAVWLKFDQNYGFTGNPPTKSQLEREDPRRESVQMIQELEEKKIALQQRRPVCAAAMYTIRLCARARANRYAQKKGKSENQSRPPGKKQRGLRSRSD